MLARLYLEKNRKSVARMAIAFSCDGVMSSIMVAEVRFEVVEVLPESRGAQKEIGFKEALNADLLEK